MAGGRIKRGFAALAASEFPDWAPGAPATVSLVPTRQGLSNQQAGMPRSCRHASGERAPARHGPDALDPLAADADVPIVQVDRRVAMAGDEADLFADVETLDFAFDVQ